MINFTAGGITEPKGFKAAGIHCGIRRNTEKKDLALIYCEKICDAAAVYTKNLVKGAPILVTERNLMNGYAQAAICNSGNANTCNADGEEKAEQTCAALAKELKINSSDIIIASTGVIGQPLNINAITEAIPSLVKNLSVEGSSDAAMAIMTTDLVKKEYAVTFKLGGKNTYIGGIAKGSGMINPNMATMLAFLTTDAAISSEMLLYALKESVKNTYNMLTIDGDTSTNDMASIMASGLAGNPKITEKNKDYKTFVKALTALNTKIVRAMARDGEGATKLVECRVCGAPNGSTARTAAKSVVSSSLVKAAMFGSDANWGRVLCALGYAGKKIDIKKIDVSFISKTGSISVCREGAGIPFSEEKAKKVLSDDEITIEVNLHDGSSKATAFGCDLTYDYVKINGDYRT